MTALVSGTSRNAPPDDFEGAGRPVGAGDDIGAFEWIRNEELLIDGPPPEGT